MIISHGGKGGDFPILALAIEKTFGEQYITALECIARATFRDSLLTFKNAGYSHPGMATLTDLFGIDNVAPHTALSDASALKQLCMTNEGLVFNQIDRVTLQDILHEAWRKLPLSLCDVFALAAEMRDHDSDSLLTEILTSYADDTSAQKYRLVWQIVRHYKNRYEVYRSHKHLAPDKALWTALPNTSA